MEQTGAWHLLPGRVNEHNMTPGKTDAAFKALEILKMADDLSRQLKGKAPSDRISGAIEKGMSDLEGAVGSGNYAGTHMKVLEERLDLMTAASAERLGIGGRHDYAFNGGVFGLAEKQLAAPEKHEENGQRGVIDKALSDLFGSNGVRQAHDGKLPFPHVNAAGGVGGGTLNAGMPASASKALLSALHPVFQENRAGTESLSSLIPKSDIADSHDINKAIDAFQLRDVRLQRITLAANREFWGLNSATEHSMYVGSHGRNTATDASDVDILVEMPNILYFLFSCIRGNIQQRFLNAVEHGISSWGSVRGIRADGQVVVINFSDGMKFEVLPAFIKGQGDETYKYPDVHDGGKWKDTNPLAEQRAMEARDESSAGLLCATCRYLRLLRAEFYPEEHVSGILIDSFVYHTIGSWKSRPAGEYCLGPESSKAYVKELRDYFSRITSGGKVPPRLSAPGSGDSVENPYGWKVLGRILDRMAG